MLDPLPKAGGRVGVAPGARPARGAESRVVVETGGELTGPSRSAPS